MAQTIKGVLKYLIDRPIICLAGLIVLDIGLIMLLPASQTTLRIYNISAYEYRVLLFAITIPSIITWCCAFAAYITLRKYAGALHASHEGQYFQRLSTGVTWLAWSLPLTSISTLILNALSYIWPNTRPAAIITGNYIGLVLLIVAFVIISRAGRGLMDYAKVQFSPKSAWTIMAVFALAGVSYCYYAFRNLDMSSLGASDNPYFLPVWLLLLTIILPYMFTWFNGFLAVYEITLFSQKITGLLYRRSLRYLAGGLVIVIISSIALQYINAIQPRVGYLLMDYKLMITTLVRLVRATGFVLMAYGAIKLRRIEEV